MIESKVKDFEYNFELSIIELDFHFDCLDGLIKIFENSNILVNVFTTKKNLFLLKNITYANNIIFYPFTGFSKYLFLKKYKFILTRSNLIFINTIASDFGAYLALDKSKIIILRVHNINKQFNPNNSIVYPKSFFELWKFFSYIVRQVIFKGFPIFRRLINRRVNFFSFPDNGIKKYAISQKYVPIEKALNTISLKIFGGKNEVTFFKNELQITIIGSTDKNRRNYDIVICALQNIYDNIEINLKIKLVILGKTYGKIGEEIISACKAIKNSNFSFVSFDKNIDESEFVEYMNTSHLIISPIVKYAKNDIYREIYGQTKTSGSVLDFIKFGIITLVPDYYCPPKEFEEFMKKYSNANDLASQILYYYNNPNILNLNNMAAKKYVSDNYNKEVILNECLEIIKKLNVNVEKF